MSNPITTTHQEGPHWEKIKQKSKSESIMEAKPPMCRVMSLIGNFQFAADASPPYARAIIEKCFEEKKIKSFIPARGTKATAESGSLNDIFI